jgi:dTDP-D-glucose 4,6-dehydratase
VYNIGSTAELTALDIAARICAMFGLPTADYVQHVSDRDFNDQRYFVDATRLRALGWSEVGDWASRSGRGGDGGV